MDPLRIGVLGTGVIVREFHMHTLKKNTRARVVAAGNHRRESLDALGSEFGIRRLYTDFEALARDPEIDAVVNALPNYLHLPITEMMLEAGKHVLCEKPMAMSVEEARKMAGAAQRHRKRLMIGHMWRFDHELNWLQSLITEGTLGEIVKARSYAISIQEGPDPAGWFTNLKHAGGGALIDMGIHAADILRYLLGEATPVRVSASVRTSHSDIETDDTAEVLVEFEGGVTAVIEAGWYHPYADGQEGHSRIYGTNGYAQALPCEARFHDARGRWRVYKPMMPKRRQPCDMPMYHRQIEHFLNCIAEDREPVPGAAEGIWALQIVEAAYESARTGRTVDIES